MPARRSAALIVVGLVLAPLLFSAASSKKAVSMSLASRAARAGASARCCSGPALSADGLFVADFGVNGILVFDKSARGNTAPEYEIAGKSTHMDLPEGVAFGANGDLFVVNSGTEPPPNVISSVTVFARGAKGNVAPIRAIVGPNTQLNTNGSFAESIAVGALGKLYVGVSSQSSGQAFKVLIFAPGANGNVAPISTIYLNRVLGERVSFAYLAIDAKNNLVVSYTFTGKHSGIATFSADGHHLVANLNRQAGLGGATAIGTDPRTNNVEVRVALNQQLFVYPPNRTVLLGRSRILRITCHARQESQ